MRGSRWLTSVQVGLLGLVAILASFAVVAFQQSRTRAQDGQRPRAIRTGRDGGRQFPGGRGFGGVREDRKLVGQFDRNGDGRLDAAERQTARASMPGDPGREPGFRPRFGGHSFAVSAPGRRIAPAEVTSYSGAPLYDPATLRTIFLQFDTDTWEQELEAFYRSDVEVPATAIVDRRTYQDVGVHFRGASSFMMVPRGSKRSLNLSFDFVDRRQTLGGYTTLNLLNAHGDGSFLRAVLYSQIARAYMPAPKANYVRVVINGESWGIYVNAQQFNKDFLHDYFGTTKGARWKVPGSPGGHAGLNYLGDDVEAYKRLYEMKTKDDPKAWADLIHLCKVLNETPADRLEAALDPILNIDGALKFLALDIALVNSDGYWTRASDYSIYQDVKGRFHIIPHDMNEGLVDEAGRGRGGPPPSVDLDPLAVLGDPNKALRSQLLAVPAFRARYLGYVRDIAENWLDWKRLGPIAARYQALIAADVKADTRKLYSTEAFEGGLDDSPDSLKTFVQERRAFLLSR
jgi:hypothetical protein